MKMSLDGLKKFSLDLLSRQHFDSLAVGVIDFQKHSFETFEISAQNIISTKPYLYFDLASVTKALVNSTAYLEMPQIFDEKMKLLLCHRAGLPSGGLLSKDSWKEQILSYSIQESETLYSDYSSLRCMLEIEKKAGIKIRDISEKYFDQECKYWFELPENSFSPEYGVRGKKVVCGEVHDNNCFNLKEFVSHAGLFATVDGLCRTLINIDQKLKMCTQMKAEFDQKRDQHRFMLGFDHVTDLENTLAGSGCSKNTFGHLGFVGTSFWIDLDKNRGAVVLTNGVQTYWYDKTGLNDLRRKIGNYIWTKL